MKKQIHMLSLVAGACLAGSACAQSAVQLYGVIDNAVEYQDGGAGAVNRVVSSALYASVYGFKGSEDLGNGVQLKFQLEQGFSGDTGAQTDSAAAFNRLAWIGLSGDFGEVRLGRQKKPEYLLMNYETDPTGVKSIASPMNNFGDDSVRSSNALAYFTPKAHGLEGQFMMALREEPNQPRLLSWNAVTRYVNGELRAVLGYERTGKAGSPVVQKVLRGVVSYGIGKARYYVAYQGERTSDTLEKLRIYTVSASWLFNPKDQLSLLYGFANDRSGQGNDGQQVGLLYQHILSKRTQLYSAFGYLQNRNEGQFTLDGTQYKGITGAPGHDVKGINFGITHKF
jgi:predicted porin